MDGLLAVNRRGCYCELWDKDPTYFETRGVPPGYCGFCQTCKKPGHTRHFPGAASYTGCWCDFHYRLLSFLHPLGSPGMILYLAIIAVILWIVWHS
jgi:hypothetical protein